MPFVSSILGPVPIGFVTTSGAKQEGQPNIAQAPGLRPRSTCNVSCKTCVHYLARGHTGRGICELYDFVTYKKWVCDSWEPERPDPGPPAPEVWDDDQRSPEQRAAAAERYRGLSRSVIEERRVWAARSPEQRAAAAERYRGLSRSVIEEHRGSSARGSRNTDPITAINAIISSQTSYGDRRWQVSNWNRSTILSWANNRASWGILGPAKMNWKRDENSVTLDANEILVPFTQKVIRPLLLKLKPLPLYSRSYEVTHPRGRGWNGGGP